MRLDQGAEPDRAALAVKAKKRCDAFNKLLSDPLASLQMYERTGRVCVAVQRRDGARAAAEGEEEEDHDDDDDDDDLPTAQRAFLALSDRAKHDRLRFGAADSGAIWLEFVDDDLVEWRAELNPNRPPSPSTAAYEIVLCKL